MFRSTVFAVLLQCAFLLPAIAGADSAKPADTPAPSAHALGVADGLLKYCEKADAPAALAIQKGIKGLVGNSSAVNVARIRASDEYRSAYNSITDFLARVDDHNAHVVCSRPLTSAR
jgi:hypothetical protein